MKTSIKSLLLAVSLLGMAGAASAGTAVSVSIGDPNFFGRIDIGGAPPPRVIYTEPVIVERPRGYMERPPLYLRVPAGYQSNWRRHCRAYNACGQRVYFVQDTWYRDSYVPHYREHHGRPPMHHGRPPMHHDDRRDHHDDRRDHRDDRHDDRHDGRPGGRDDHRGPDRRP